MILSFTGPSKPTRTEASWCNEELQRLDASGIWRSGAAVGLDTLAALVPQPSNVHFFVPAGHWHNEDLVARLHRQGALVTNVEGGYRPRNEMLVAGSDELHAFLKDPSFYRSGEWMTANIARRIGVTVVEHIIPKYCPCEGDCIMDHSTHPDEMALCPYFGS